MKPRFSARPRSGENEAQARSFRWRSSVVLGLVILGAAGLAARSQPDGYTLYMASSSMVVSPSESRLASARRDGSDIT